MIRPDPIAEPHPPPEPVADLAAFIEGSGIAAWSQGEGLLADLRADREGPSPATTPLFPGPTRSFVCTASAEDLLRLLPRAVVTGAGGSRLSVATEWGPVDLLPLGTRPLEEAMGAFGLGPYGFAWRAARGAWCDPFGAREAFTRGELSLATSGADGGEVFERAPRRYWIAARLLAEHRLTPSPSLLHAAGDALPSLIDRIPRGAVARRAVERILFAPEPHRGLAFLRDCGLSARFFDGVRPEDEALIRALPRERAFRWAGWLRGTAVQRALVMLRMPPDRAKAIGRIRRVHPIDATIEGSREAGMRKLLRQFTPEEIEGLIAWRRLEIEHAKGDRREALERLERALNQLTRFRERQESLGRVRSLALDGGAIMSILGAGPGPHVGRALAHLARWIERHPESNEPAALERELRTWAREQPDLDAC
ncbi:MAG: hypothetical protein JRG86_03860 [Deltaproteobacteria bacterium]|jgi:tRNA nucleotidyltransferase (CCA-adding enzyme)|nr:hypothetical protein [Deltaproteobacteria bacterium]MBW2501227.1 hypothetical protein [Deltaproteobacteria bacterium]